MEVTRPPATYSLGTYRNARRTGAFAGAASILTSVVFGLVPALQASRLDLRAGLHTTGATLGGVVIGVIGQILMIIYFHVWQDEVRDLNGVPRMTFWEHPLTAVLAIVVGTLNVIYGLANLARGQETAKVTPKTWWANMENGWVWDLDDFVVNQIGHPYQGSNYYNAGRGNGLSFYESAAMTASASWSRGSW